MKVRVYPEKTIEEFGARRWQVEWQEVSPAALKRQAADDSYDFDMDTDLVTYCRYYKTKEKALDGARHWHKKRSDWLAFGSMIVQEQVVVWGMDWKAAQ